MSTEALAFVLADGVEELPGSRVAVAGASEGISSDCLEASAAVKKVAVVSCLRKCNYIFAYEFRYNTTSSRKTTPHEAKKWKIEHFIGIQVSDTSTNFTI